MNRRTAARLGEPGRRLVFPLKDRNHSILIRRDAGAEHRGCVEAPGRLAFRRQGDDAAGAAERRELNADQGLSRRLSRAGMQGDGPAGGHREWPPARAA